MAGFAQETATARLARLLTMVPWLVNRQGIDLQQAADDLGVSVEQLEADLNLLFLCGYGQLPDELIEADWEEGRVFVGNADTIARPLRLGVDEAVTLVVGLRALREVPGLGDRDAVERALAKLEDAAGAAAAPARRVRAEVADGASPELLALAQQAIADHRRVHLRYLVPARDEATERDVDPMRVVGMDGSWYLEGWCHRAEDTRMFRMDRVEELTVLDVDGTPPAGCPRARPVRGHLPAGPRRPRRDPAAAARGHLGGRLLPGRVGARTCRRPRGAACWCGCAPPTRRGCAGWCGGSGAGARCSTRRRWSPRCVTGLVPPWRPTRHPGPGPDAVLPWWGWVLVWARGAARVGGRSSGGGPGSCGAAPPCWRARCSGRAGSWPSWRPAPTSCATWSSPGRGRPADSQDAGGVSGATGLDQGGPPRTPNRPASAVGARTLTRDRAGQVEQASRHHRRWTPWAGSDPPRSSSSRC